MYIKYTDIFLDAGVSLQPISSLTSGVRPSHLRHGLAHSCFLSVVLPLTIDAPVTKNNFPKQRYLLRLLCPSIQCSLIGLSPLVSV